MEEVRGRPLVFLGVDELPEVATHSRSRRILACVEVGHLMVRALGCVLRHSMCPIQVFYLRLRILICEIA
jgi:hypothetical protein